MKQNRIILNFVIIFIIISFIISIFASSTTSFATSPSFVKKYKTITIGKNIQYQIKNLKKNQEIDVVTFEIKDAETSPPIRYNSGSIILAMENAGKLIEDESLREQIKGAGIGTSATRAEIMKKLERIGYIAINSKTQIITPTDKGEVIYDVVFSSMPDMLNPELTASWEKGLDMVAKKEIEPVVFMEKLEKYIRNKIGKLVVPM